jgi:predicted phage terminase large subunit-like protein
LLSKGESAQSAPSNQAPAGTGETNYAWITATTQEKCAGYSAITATSQLETGKQKPHSFAPPNTSEFDLDEVAEIIFDGIEDVFDIQVEGTENFIANGLVSHNTRWHDDDLSGRLLEAQKDGGDQWDVLSLPAIDEGAALWPEWYPLDRLEQIRSVLPARDWNALYQQNPIPDDGDYFKTAWFGEYDEPPKNMRIYGASDYAVTDGGGDYTAHGVFGLDTAGNLYVLDWWRGQTAADVWIDSFCDAITKHQPLCWFGEAGPIRRAVEPFMRARMIERGALCRIEWLASISDKPTRARSFQAMASMGKVLIPKRATWLADVMNELLRFPAGKNDDSVDVCSLIGRGLQFIGTGKRHTYDYNSSAAQGAAI